MLARPDVTDIYVNRPGELWVETIGGAIERHDAPGARRGDPGAPRPPDRGALPPGDQPRASAALRDPARRRAGAGRGAAGDARAAGARDPQARLARPDARRLCRGRRVRRDAAPRFARALRRRHGAGRRSSTAGDIAGMLAAAVRARKNILVSGGTSTGKTTFLNALLREIPAEERLILIEDTPELQVAPRECGRAARRAQRARRGAGDRERSARRLAAHAAGPDHPRRAARRGGLRLPARGQHRPSGIDDHGPCRQRRARDRADRAARRCRPAPSSSRDDVRHYITQHGRRLRPARPHRRPPRVAEVVLSH